MKKLFILFILLLTGCTNSYEKVTIAQTKEMLTNNEIKLIIDVRTKEEYDMGHIENAINIPYDQIEDNLEYLKQYKNDTILVYCRTSNRSTIAANTLHNNNFKKVYAMTDGYSNWK
jgi:phage shock protein E